MSFNANDLPSTGSSSEPMDSGSYPARVVSLAIMGLQKQEFQGEVKEPKIQMYITYEMLDEFLKDENDEDILDKPRWVNENFPFNRLDSLKAKSTIRYNSLDQTHQFEGDFSKLLTVPCMVTIVQNAGKGKHAGKTFANISTVSAMRPKEAAKAGPLVNEPYLFDFYAPTKASWDRLSDYMKEIAKGALDYEGSALEKFITTGVETVSVPPSTKDETIDDEIPW